MDIRHDCATPVLIISDGIAAHWVPSAAKVLHYTHACQHVLARPPILLDLAIPAVLVRTCDINERPAGRIRLVASGAPFSRSAARFYRNAHEPLQPHRFVNLQEG